MIQSKQMIAEGVALRSFTAREGRFSAGMRIKASLARLEELERVGLVRVLSKTKAIAVEEAISTKKAAPAPEPPAKAAAPVEPAAPEASLSTAASAPADPAPKTAAPADNPEPASPPAPVNKGKGKPDKKKKGGR